MGKLNLQLCPRCELNYCENGQEYCKICLAEIERNSSSVESEEKILCPICKSVYISMDEDMEKQFSEEYGDEFDDDDDLDEEETYKNDYDDDLEKDFDESLYDDDSSKD